MKKIKKFFRSIFVFFMCLTCIFISACGGGWSVDEIDPEEIEDFQFGMNLDNVKVLRRSYGSNKATAVATGYYSDYVFNVVRYLTDIYGLINEDIPKTSADGKDVFSDILSDDNSLNVKHEKVEYADDIKQTLEDLQYYYITPLPADKNDPLYNIIQTGKDNFKYFYDAVRYQIVDVIYYYSANWRFQKEDGTYIYSNDHIDGYEENYELITFPVEDDQVPTKLKVIASTDYGWNWGLNYVLEDIDDNKANSFVWEYSFGGTMRRSSWMTDGSNVEINNFFDNNNFSFDSFDIYYKGNGSYIRQSPFSTSLYTSQFYSAKNPKEEGYAPTNFQKALEYAVYCILNKEEPHEVRVDKTGTTGSTFTVDGYDTLDKALESAKEKYLNTCAYVGITTERVKPNEECDKEKIVNYILNNVIGENAINFSKSTESKQNLYYEELVDAVVTYCTALTSIGEATVYTEEDEEVIEGAKAAGDLKHEAVTIGGQYLSSDIVDYEYNSAMVNGQNEGIEEFSHLGEYEYQSMMLMPESDTKIDEIWLDFGYLGDYVGTNDSIQIKTYVRYYQGDGRMQIFEKVITVQEHSVDVGEDGTTLLFDFSELKKNDEEAYLRLDKINFNRAINSEFYKQRRQGVLQPSSSEFPKELTLSADGDARNYYKYVQGEYRDYGVFDYTQLVGKAYDSHYVEIAFEVMNVTCSNYKFLCGISLLTAHEELDTTKWH